MLVRSVAAVHAHAPRLCPYYPVARCGLRLASLASSWFTHSRYATVGAPFVQLAAHQSTVGPIWLSLSTTRLLPMRQVVVHPRIDVADKSEDEISELTRAAIASAI